MESVSSSSKSYKPGVVARSSSVLFSPTECGVGSKNSKLTSLLLEGGSSNWRYALRTANIGAAILHILLTVGFGMYFCIKMRDAPTGVDLLPLDFYTHDKPSVARKRFRISEQIVINLIISFFLLTAAAHLFYAADLGGIYTDMVARGNMSFRWIEYSITATIMTVVIATTAGVRDAYALILLTFLTIGIMSTGQWFEREMQRNSEFGGENSLSKEASTPLTVGFLLLAGLWYVIISSYYDRVREINETSGAEKIPSWVIFAVLTTLSFFTIFGFLPFIQWWLSSSKNYIGSYPKYEMGYIVLSFLAKTCLASFLAYGIGERIDAV
jgi:hypothetical protein